MLSQVACTPPQLCDLLPQLKDAQGNGVNHPRQWQGARDTDGDPKAQQAGIPTDVGKAEGWGIVTVAP